MPRLLRVLAALALAAVPAVAAPPPQPDWAYDVLKLKNGVVHRGLLLEEGKAGVRFQVIARKPGRPTVWVTFAFKKEDVAKLDKLSDDERAALKAKLEEIDPSPEAEARRADRIDLKTVEWDGKKNAGLRYESDYFTLVGGAPTVIQVYQSLDGYRKAAPGGAGLQNPAFYDPSANRVVCGTDLKKLGD